MEVIMSKQLLINAIAILCLIGSVPVTAMIRENNTENAQMMCHVCYDFKSTDMVTLSCGHHYCKECFTAFIDNALKERNLRNIRCPHYHCYNRQLSAQEFEIFISNEQRAKINELQTQKWLSEQAHVKHCPTPDCKHAFINESTCQSNQACPGCHHTYCSQCMNKHPEHVSCQAAREQFATPEDKANQQWKQQNSKQCPKCQAHIEKNRGCDHMTCSKCRYEFCWKCLDKYPCDIRRCMNIQLERIEQQPEIPAPVQNLANRFNRLAPEQLLQFTNNMLNTLNTNPATDPQVFMQELEQLENRVADINVRADMPRDFQGFTHMLTQAGINVQANPNGTLQLTARMQWDTFNRILDLANALYR